MIGAEDNYNSSYPRDSRLSVSANIVFTCAGVRVLLP